MPAPAAPAAPARPVPRLALVVPCYNEQAIIADTLRILADHLAQWTQQGLIRADSFAVYTDDGSADGTWTHLAQAASPHCHVIKLAHNVGHQNALFAGMVYAADRCDCCISLDADLQDDLSIVPQMLQEYRNGCEVVYGVRNDRSSDSLMKRTVANGYYLLARLLGVAGIPNHADYRLVSRRALLVIREFQEQHLYWRGIVPSLNLPSAKVYYRRLPRQGGAPKYTVFKLAGLAMRGITSFSIVPLRFITVLGLLISLGSFFYIIEILQSYYSGVKIIQGWRTLIISLYFLGGLIMLSLGITGEYIGKIFMESKKRPLFVIEDQRNSPPPPPA